LPATFWCAWFAAAPDCAGLLLGACLKNVIASSRYEAALKQSI
jgi:hypothetical protein